MRYHVTFFIFFFFFQWVNGNKVETEIIICITLVFFFFIIIDPLTPETDDGESDNSQSQARSSILNRFLSGFFG